MDDIKKAFNSEHAKQYDSKANEMEWLDPAVVFGLVYPDIQPGENLLDIGIGTGLSSQRFHKAGLQIFGLDFSGNMLECCQQKGIVAGLKEHDLRDTPYPFRSEEMHHAVCTGVTHLFEELDVIFSETARILKQGGCFCISVAECEGTKTQAQTREATPHSGKRQLYCHPLPVIKGLFGRFGFDIIASLPFVSSSIFRQPTSFRAYVARKL